MEKNSSERERLLMSVSPSNLQSETISEHFSGPITRQMRWPRALNRELSTLFPQGKRSPTAVTCLYTQPRTPPPLPSPPPFVEKTMAKRFSRDRREGWMRFDVPKCRESKKLTTEREGRRGRGEAGLFSKPFKEEKVVP